MTVDELAVVVEKGFKGVDAQFKGVNRKLDNLASQIGKARDLRRIR